MKKSLLVLAVVAALDCAAATAGEFVRAQAGRGIPDCYVVVLKPDAVVRAGALKAGVTVSQLAVGAAARFGGRIEHFYETALTGYSICLPEKAAQLLADEPSVELVEQDQVMSTVATQSGATWGIDRIDQRNLPLSGTYTYNFNGAGVHAYIIDTGIRATHQQFGGRVSGGTALGVGGHAALLGGRRSTAAAGGVGVAASTGCRHRERGHDHRCGSDPLHGAHSVPFRRHRLCALLCW